LKKKKPRLYSKSIPKISDATAPGILEKKKKKNSERDHYRVMFGSQCFEWAW